VNGRQRIAAALAGEWPDRVPVMLHNFLMAAREAGVSQRRFREDPAAIAASFIRAVETYDYDGVLVDVDTATLAEALGVPIRLPDDEPAHCAGGCLPDLAAVPDLGSPDVGRHPRVQVWVEAVRLLRAHFGTEIFIRGNCDQAPFSLAGLMRGQTGWLMDLLDPANLEAAHALLSYCEQAAVQFMNLVAGAGADMLSNGDSPAGPDVISPVMYARFAQPFERALADESHRLGLPYALHICGDTTRILEGMIATGADALEVDHKADLLVAHAALRERTTFIGNIDPSGVLALGSPADVERAAGEVLDVFSDTPRVILNAGCAIPAGTPPENLRAMIRAARRLRRQPC
jgi:uroporphyrinogen decarboxylase